MKPKGRLVFVHDKTGDQVTLFWENNDLNGATMYWFSITRSMYASDMKTVKNLIKKIKERCEIIQEVWE